MKNIIKIVSLRKNSPFKSSQGDLVFPIHRGNKILGNPFVMKDFSDKERQRVIQEYKQKLDMDLARRGPIYAELRKIAHHHAQTGRTIALECWCAPEACHGDLMVPIIEAFIKEST